MFVIGVCLRVCACVNARAGVFLYVRVCVLKLRSNFAQFA